MPQLDPSPWLTILILSWLIFLTILPQKVATHIYPRILTSEGTNVPNTLPWHWEWH